MFIAEIIAVASRDDNLRSFENFLKERKKRRKVATEKILRYYRSYRILFKEIPRG